jgi:PAS domain S-box-containing protein
MKERLTKRPSVPLMASMWLALAILAAVAGFAYTSMDAAETTLGRVEHTDRVLWQIGDVSTAHARAVSARLVYVVGGSGAQLANLPALDAAEGRAIDDLRHSVAENPDQLRRVDSLARLVGQRIAALDAAVDRRRRESIGGETPDEVELASRIRDVRQQMDAEEHRLLLERDDRTRHNLSRTKMGVIVGPLASLAFLLFAFGRLGREIALRQRSGQALRASEAFLDSIVENIPDMIFVKNAGELRFERINHAGEELLGIARTEMIGKCDFDFFPPEQAEFFQARDRETLAAGVVVDIPEEPILTKKGERWLHTKKVPILDEQGSPRYLLGISDDITERRSAAAALSDAKDAAEAANQELETFSYSVAHDLRAPLRAIDGFGLALEEDCGGQLDPTCLEHLSRIRGSAKQMGRLIDGLLGLSRVTRGDLGREKVDLTRLAEQSGARLREANPARHNVELSVQPGLAAEGDPRLLIAVVDNLLGNAWKFTAKKERARIEVGSRLDQDRTVFYVRDNGAGFDNAYAHKLFGAFQRLHSANEFDGSGIGLATVQRIIRRHGGRIWAEGEVGRGATFYFTLRGDPPDREDHEVDRKKGVGDGSENDSAGGRRPK